MRALLITSALLLLYTSCHAASDYIAAVANGDIVSFSQVRIESAPEVARLRKTLKGEQALRAIKIYRVSVLNRLVDRLIILQELKRLDAPLPENATDQQIEAATRSRFRGDRRQWLDRLRHKIYIRTFGTLLEDCRDLERHV
jgi:hypothetical protein